MNGITSLSPSQLRRAADLQERILALQDDFNQILGAPAPGPIVATPKRTKISPKGLANIRAESEKGWRWSRLEKPQSNLAKGPSGGCLRRQKQSYRLWQRPGGE